ncbi:hypothetical protein MPSEU_000017100 [Mayamaea pseudoterrestris]|nr:hypothetical protein MPSEU_000017100 [Mayamaea pseudoterrestris]
MDFVDDHEQSHDDLWDSNFEEAILGQGVSPRSLSTAHGQQEQQQTPWHRKLSLTSPSSKENRQNSKHEQQVELLQQTIKSLEEQVISAHAPVEQLEHDLVSAEMERVSLQEQVQTLEATVKMLNKELTRLRLESMDDLTVRRNGASQADYDCIKVPLNEWRELQGARDTAMFKAGELAIELATCRASNDELEEQLLQKDVMLQEAAKDKQAQQDTIAKLEARLAKYEQAEAGLGGRSWGLRRNQSTSSLAASVSAVSLESGGSGSSCASEGVNSSHLAGGTSSYPGTFLNLLRGGLKTPLKEELELNDKIDSKNEVPNKVSFVLCSDDEEGGESDDDENDDLANVVSPASTNK